MMIKNWSAEKVEGDIEIKLDDDTRRAIFGAIHDIEREEMPSINISDGAVILSKEAYSDLCLRASGSNEKEEVVHCKDCQYAYFDRPHPICGYINDAYMLVKEGYCSHGIRKKEKR